MSSFFAALALKKYFELFFKNTKELNFDLNFFRGETALQNIEVNEKVFQELMDFPNLEVKRVFVSEIRVKLSLTRLKSEPVVIVVDQAELYLTEPETLSPTPSVLADFFKKNQPAANNNNTIKSDSPVLKEDGKGYTLMQKIADGLRLEAKKIKVFLQLRPEKNADGTSRLVLVFLIALMAGS